MEYLLAQSVQGFSQSTHKQYKLCSTLVGRSFSDLFKIRNLCKSNAYENRNNRKMQLELYHNIHDYIIDQNNCRLLLISYH